MTLEEKIAKEMNATIARRDASTPPGIQSRDVFTFYAILMRNGWNLSAVSEKRP